MGRGSKSNFITLYAVSRTSTVATAAAAAAMRHTRYYPLMLCTSRLAYDLSGSSNCNQCWAPSTLFLSFLLQKNSLLRLLCAALALEPNQVSDIFQFYTQRNINDPRVEDMELNLASSTSRNSSTAPSVHPLLVCSLAILVSGFFVLLRPPQHRKLKTEVI